MDTELNRRPALEAQKAIWCDRTPMKRLGDEDELNNLALFLASSASSFMTGADVIIDVSCSFEFPHVLFGWLLMNSIQGGYCLP